MQTAARRLARLAKLQGRPERFTYGPIELEVTDVERSVSFWTSALGMVPRPATDGIALGTRSETLLILHGGATEPVRHRQHSGLFNLGIGVPDQMEFSRLFARLIGNRVCLSAADHLVMKALHFHDAEGFGVIVAYETPERFGRFGNLQDGMELFDTEGRPHPGRAPLDKAQELDHARNADLDADLAVGTRIGHLNLSVPNLAAGIAFYEGLGFAQNLTLPHMGFADLGAGGAFPHRIGLNTWLGEGNSPTPEGTARLRRFHLNVAEQAIFAAASRLPNASAKAGHLHFIDPCGVEVVLRPPAEG